jgi:hypothetical protein
MTSQKVPMVKAKPPQSSPASLDIAARSGLSNRPHVGWLGAGWGFSVVSQVLGIL